MNVPDEAEWGGEMDAKEIFLRASKDHQALIREVLKAEREVMHLKRRSDIHQRIYEHVKRVIK